VFVSVVNCIYHHFGFGYFKHNNIRELFKLYIPENFQRVFIDVAIIFRMER
jgi:hypothetical protein